MCVLKADVSEKTALVPGHPVEGSGGGVRGAGLGGRLDQTGSVFSSHREGFGTGSGGIARQ